MKYEKFTTSFLGDFQYYYHIPEKGKIAVRETFGRKDCKSIHGFKWHREFGLPASVDKNSYHFYSEGIFHRMNGPASVNDDSEGQMMYINDWCIYDQIIDANEYFNWLEETDIDINNISDSDKLLIIMRWSQ